MSSFSIGRISDQATSSALLRNTQLTQRALARVQQQVATGKKIDRPSDASGAVSAVLKLRRSLAERGQAGLNLEAALATLTNIDQGLADARAAALEARDTALSQIGVTTDAETRNTMANVIDGQLQATLDIANRQYNGLSLFGGNNGAPADGLVFESFLGGVRYSGGTTNLAADVNALYDQPFTADGLEAFGAVSARVATNVNLAPLTTAATRLDDVNGATGTGVTRGEIVLSVDGTPVTVDLATADTLGDVRDRVNDAINSINLGAGSLDLATDGFDLTANPGHTITISNADNGTTASTLGIVLNATSTVVAGDPVGPRITDTTPLTDLAAPIDWASGLLLQQGETSAVADFSAANTVRDVINAIESLNLGVRAQINTAGTGLDLVSEVSGLTLSIGENGGTTATDLGLRTLDRDTPLAQFRNGVGVETVEGEPDLRVSLHDGTTIDVDLFGAVTTGDVLDRINAAGAGDVTADFVDTGNGIRLTDNTAGPDPFRIDNLGASAAASHLNLAGLGDANGTANTLDSGDQAGVRVQSVFTQLIEIRDALRQNNTTGITVAGERLEDSLERFTQTQARVGIESQRVEAQMQRNDDTALTEQTLLSELQDADLTEVITRYQQLQQQYQATLQVGAQQFQLNLLDFLG